MLALLPLVLTGCATSALWGNRDFREPAKPPELALFQSADTTRVLVLYDETSDTSEHISRRAYWLGLEEKPRRNPHRPFFVPVEQSQGLLPLAAVESTPAGSPWPNKLCVVASTNDIAFTLISEGRSPVTYRLPVYQDPAGRFKRILLTPLAVAADATIVGGYIFLWWWSEGNLSDVH